jgi:ferric-dicitrate binding protein FerR (iron transport regulator)
LDYCHDHDLGLSPAVVRELVGPERLATEHRSRRRGRRRAIARFAALLLAIAALVAAVHPVPQHGKVLYGRSGKIVVP